MVRLVSLSLALAGALTFAGATASATKPPTLIGTSGSRGSFVITFKDGKGNTVTTIKARRYKLVIRDFSKKHNFHVKGPGLSAYSRVPYVGTLSYTTLVFRSGSYSFFCDVHKSKMHGSFKVVS